jgi:alpha-beta hydrolase superfamily lysophospholipase
MLRSLSLSHGASGCLMSPPQNQRRALNNARTTTATHRVHIRRTGPATTTPRPVALVAAASSASSATTAATNPLRLPRLAALDRSQSQVLVTARAQPLQRLQWRVGDDACALEVWYRAPYRGAGVALDDATTTSSATTTTPSRPPILLVHGLFRAAWSWEEAFLPALSASGRAAYAVSLRGQGGSELAGDGDGKGNNNVAAAVQEAGGVPMDVIMADLEAVVARVTEHHAEEERRWRRFGGAVVGGGAGVGDGAERNNSHSHHHAPVLVGHSLGGMFVQEYLARLQQREFEQGAAPPPPPIRGAALLASATAGTVMDFARFASDVGLPEFLWQMWIVATGQHLRDLSVARYCWWPDEEQVGGEGDGANATITPTTPLSVPAEQARRWHALIVGSSRACPYVRGEVTRWNPPPRLALAEQEQNTTTAAAPPPPVLALGGARDRIIRPWQVAAARAHWGADVVVLPGLTHDVMLGPGAERALDALVAWLEQRVEV